MSLSPTYRSRRRRDRSTVLAAVAAAAISLALLTGTALAGSPRTAAASALSTSPSSRTAEPIVAKDYDLGIRQFPQPGLKGRLAKMPIRLWGTIAAPLAPGPHPVVVIAHGAHGDNCPGEYGEWPCWKREQRNDLGFRSLVKALAAQGFVAIAPDVNAAYTGGWGEIPSKEVVRFGQVVDATLAQLALASTGAASKLGIQLGGKVDRSRLGLLGHSRGGMNVLRWAKTKDVRSIFLLAPFFDPAQRVPDVPATILLGTCDFDTRQDGARYFTALRGRPRTAPGYQLTLTGANHNFYNQSLVVLKQDDAAGQKGRCAKPNRLTGRAQQAFLAHVVSDHFRSSLLDATPTAWMTDPLQGLVYGQKVAVKRVIP